MVQIKKASKYGKYFFFLVLASVISFVWPSKNNGQTGISPSIPHAHADVPPRDHQSDSDDAGDSGDAE